MAARILHGCSYRVLPFITPSTPSSIPEMSQIYQRFQLIEWWAHKGSNLGPLPCEGNALPLSYAPGIVGGEAASRWRGRFDAAIYEVRGCGVKRGGRKTRA